ncbi:hypothetical protein GCM10010156_17720 [Planobispora rosea]|uniref:Carrier domain-containing protein n=1 Tax=Planobispora rosea TaxID=35762 RepID=A0A8J3WC68_PLARO|nr:acyl carrier protein [Planobispora rosea]GGS59437.1 hypothetical protein GCM10010156_17720 [Planobispora rosea]GIH84619.1 hypothetical protein Pro02_30270 [Planobispora rosea]
MWDQQFEAILRRFLPFLATDEPLEPETGLRDLGLDSLGMVELLGTLESAYGTRFGEDALMLDTFASPGRLWDALSAAREPVG